MLASVESRRLSRLAFCISSRSGKSGTPESAAAAAARAGATTGGAGVGATGAGASFDGSNVMDLMNRERLTREGSSWIAEASAIRRLDVSSSVIS